jgi:hypothetical protein
MTITREWRWCLFRLRLDSWQDAYQFGVGLYLLALCLVEWCWPGIASAWLKVDFWTPQHWLRQWLYGR